MSRTLVYQIFFLCNLFVTSKTCPQSQCLPFTNEKALSTEFQRLLAEEEEEGTRLVYFKLPRLDDDASYNPSHTDRILPWRWTWARTNKEPLLSLSYDYDVLSLSLLKNQVKDLALKFTSAQLECLKTLNSSCQDLEIARALLDITKTTPNKLSKTETHVACFRVLREHWFGIGNHFEYQCCKEELFDNSNGTSINCHIPINESNWLAVFNAILAILVGVAVLYWPWFLYLVPNSNEKTSKKQSYKKRSVSQSQVGDGTSCLANDDTMASGIPVDDFSPITFQTLLQKLQQLLYPDDILDLRVKFFFLWFGLVPIFFYIKLILYFVIKTDNFDETSQKLLFQIFNSYLFVFKLERPLVYLFFIIPFFVIPCGVIFFASETRNRKNLNSLIEANSESANCIKNCLKSVTVKYFDFTKNRLSCLSKSKVFGDNHKYIACLYSVAYIVFIVPLFTMATIVAFLITLILCVAVLCPYFKFFKKLLTSKDLPNYHRIFLFYSSLSATILVIFSCQFAVRMLGFVIMGIILNAEFVVPYITFAYVVYNNINLCFRHTQNRYKEIKSIIAEKWQEAKPEEAKPEEAKPDTIPEELFKFVVIPNEKEKENVNVLPKFSTEMFRLFCRILAIVVFLSVALTAILLFKITYGVSAIVPTISVFISGKFSELFFTGITKESSFVGLEKIDLENDITYLVGRYMVPPNQPPNGHPTPSAESPKGHPTPSKENEPETIEMQKCCLF